MDFRKQKNLFFATLICLLVLFCWFFQGDFRGYEINIWYKENITMAEARELTQSVNPSRNKEL
ncbi:hypothetical protein GCM10007362_31440 [Saccharibacillus endophyticus]|uniref:Uncharacterized protein n=1 Tax=Saccharibacillus endophyticus TaxID=2060666 RepID=A0ABQ2A0S0_9BACL|nr:hypothetical protein GCM10007362_31440 [Saccharibacillus endophyticus]